MRSFVPAARAYARRLRLPRASRFRSILRSGRSPRRDRAVAAPRGVDRCDRRRHASPRAGATCSRRRRRFQLARPGFSGTHRSASPADATGGASRSALTPQSRRMPGRAGPGAAHEHGLTLLPSITLPRAKLHPASFRAQLPRGAVVGEPDVERADDLLLRPTVLDRSDELDSMVEVARHQVRAAEEELRLRAGVEDEEAAVLEDAAGDAAHAAPLAG